MERSSGEGEGGGSLTDEPSKGEPRRMNTILLCTTEKDSRTQTKVKVLSSCEVHKGVSYFHFLVSIS